MNNIIYHKISRYNKGLSIPSIFTNGVIITDGFDAKKHLDVLEGKVAIYIAKNVIPKEDCIKIALAFQKSIHKDKYNVVPIIEKIGNPLYLGGKTHINDYFNTAKVIQERINIVYNHAGVPNYPKKIFETLKCYLAQKNILLRPIVHGDKSGIYGILRSWGAYNVNKNFATPIHEDKLQVRLHEGVETKLVLHSNLASTCLYYSNGNNINDGKLTVYDVRLLEKDAKYEQFGSNGEYGYSEEFVRNASYISIVPQPGDLITFLADHLHSVSGISEGSRINASFNTAFREDNNKVCLIWS